MGKKNTSIRINEELWKEAKKKAIDKDKTIGEFIEGLIKKEIGDNGGNGGGYKSGLK